MQSKRGLSKKSFSGLHSSLRMVGCGSLPVAGARRRGTAQPDRKRHQSQHCGRANALKNVTGFDNTAIGYTALFETTSGGCNTGVGSQTLNQNTTGSYNTAIGYSALLSNTTGSDNTAIGYTALYSNTTGSFNTATGYEALDNNTTGNWNTADGYSALGGNIGGGYNTASGYHALSGNTNGGYNTASGKEALFSNTTGGYNTGFGAEALYSNVLGSNNTVIGAKALRSATNSTSNVAVGYNALTALAGTSGGNIALGANAGYLTKGGNNNIYIGNWGVSGNESNVTRIGRTQTRVFIKGIAGVPLSGAHVVVNSAGQLGIVASSARYKQDIRPLTDASERLSQLRPVSFSYSAEPGATHYGLIAEEVDAVMPELVVRDEQDRPETVQYLELIPLLLQERQEMQTELTRQRELIEQQAETLATLQRALETRFAALDAIGRLSIAHRTSCSSGRQSNRVVRRPRTQPKP